MSDQDLPLFIEYLDEDGNSYMRISESDTIIIKNVLNKDKDNKDFYASVVEKATKAEKDNAKALYTAGTLGRNTTKVDIKKEEKKQLDKIKADKINEELMIAELLAISAQEHEIGQEEPVIIAQEHEIDKKTK